jgi:hypothetical protein
MEQKQARVDKQQAAEDVWQWQYKQMDPNQPFIGVLNSQKKADLQDITYSLGLDIKGKVEEIKLRINDHFNTHEDVCTSPHYIGLFPQLAQQNCQMLSMTAPLQLTTPTNAQSSTYCNNNHDTLNHLTLNAHNQHFDTPQLHIPTPTLSAPGPSNQLPLQPMVSGYIAYNPPHYYNVSTYSGTHWP